MHTRIWISIGLTLVLALAFAAPAFAGGWAVITLDELPTDVVAGEPLKIGFVVRQHGVTPLPGLYPIVTARLSSEETLTFKAEPEGESGHYTATLTFPKEGNWDWSIQAFTMDQSMPPLTVTASGAAPALEPQALTASVSSLWVLRTVVFGMAMVGLSVAFRRRSRLAATLAGLCLLVGIGTFMLESTTPEVEAQGKSHSEASVSQVEVGRQLFIAKGCITCHYNGRAAHRSEYWTIEMGAPDLTSYSSHPDVLFIRLKDPAAAKSDTKMPDLGLKEAEIEALIAFINSK